jgi:aspartate ammonia-lyase
MPLIADALLGSIGLLTAASHIFRKNCITGITANEEECQRQVFSSTSAVTALVPRLGYEKASLVAKYITENKATLYEAVGALTELDSNELSSLLSPDAVCKLGN